MSDVVLLTGASSGLGLTTSRLLMRSDRVLVLTAREESLSRFEEAGIRQSDRLLVRPLDIIDADQRREVIQELEDRFGGVDVLINNAGVTYRSVVEHVSEAERIEQLEVNFLAPMELVRLVLPCMRRRRRGRIINVSSVGGMMAMPTMAVYSASKFALEGATESLYYEVKPWGIKVSLVEPGFIHSSSFRRVHYTHMSRVSQDDPRDPYHMHYHHMAPFIERMMGLAMATPESLARKIVKTMNRRNPPLRVPGTHDAYIFDMLRPCCPGACTTGRFTAIYPALRNGGSCDCPERPAGATVDPLLSNPARLCSG